MDFYKELIKVKNKISDKQEKNKLNFILETGLKLTEQSNKKIN